MPVLQVIGLIVFWWTVGALFLALNIYLYNVGRRTYQEWKKARQGAAEKKEEGDASPVRQEHPNRQ